MVREDLAQVVVHHFRRHLTDMLHQAVASAPAQLDYDSTLSSERNRVAERVCAKASSAAYLHPELRRTVPWGMTAVAEQAGLAVVFDRQSRQVTGRKSKCD